jgi:peptidoglycan/LPS O-acetylase OafA/YrhL
MDHMNLENSRIKQLDGLRGLAVLFVVAFHYINNQISIGLADQQSATTFQKILLKTTYFGWVGVDLFFVLSGFLIGSILLRNKKSINLFKTFYIRRFVRIIPIYYLLLVVFFTCKQAIATPNVFMFDHGFSLTYYFLFIQNFAMGFNNTFGFPALVPTWSLAVEEQFYLIIPLIVYFFKQKNLKFFIAFCLIVAPICRHLSANWYQQYTLLLCRIDAPAMGFLIAYLLQNEKIKIFLFKNLKSVKYLTVFLILVSVVLYKYSDVDVFNHSIISTIFGFTIFIIVHTESGFVFKFTTSKVLVFLGGISYFVYLYHLLILHVFHFIFLNHSAPQMKTVADCLLTISALFTTILFAMVSFRFLERPLIAWSHKFKY